MALNFTVFKYKEKGETEKDDPLDIASCNSSKPKHSTALHD
jgi:hypothetical protein